MDTSDVYTQVFQSLMPLIQIASCFEQQRRS